MQVHSLGSGSSGNAYIVSCGKRYLLLDAGLSGKRIMAGLTRIGANPANLIAVLVSHEHNDHIAGAGVISRRLNIPLYMTRGTWQASSPKIGRIRDNNICFISPGVSFALADLEITPFSILHDAIDPVSFAFDTGRHKMVVLTDTGCITKAMLRILAGCHAMILEANHDIAMLRQGPYPWPLKERVASSRGHLSNLQAAKTAAWLAQNGKLNQLQLGHLSAVNNSPKFAQEEVSGYLAGAGLAAEPVFNIAVLPRRGIGPMLQVR